MAEDSQLPALISETLPEPKTFDGMSADDLLAWLQQATVALIAAEKWTDQHRLNVGAGLYMLREQLGDGAYGQAEQGLANQIKVSTRTLNRWRVLYEKTRELPPPGPSAKRAAGQKRRHAAKLRHGVPTSGEGTQPFIDTTGKQIPNAHLSGLEPDEPTGEAPPAPAPAPPALSSAKDENKAITDLLRPLLAVDPAILSRAVKRPELIKMEGLAKRAQQANADDGSRVVLLAPDLVTRLAVAPSEPFDAGVNRAIRDLAAPKPATAPATKKASGSKTRPAPARPPAPVDERAVQEAEYGTVNGKCIHPPSRVRNGLCFLCGAENIKASR